MNRLQELELEINSMESLNKKGCLSQYGLIVLEEKKKEFSDMKKKKVKAPGVFIERAALCTIEGLRAICGTDEEYSEYVNKILKEKESKQSGRKGK